MRNECRYSWDQLGTAWEMKEHLTGLLGGDNVASYLFAAWAFLWL